MLKHQSDSTSNLSQHNHTIVPTDQKTILKEILKRFDKYEKNLEDEESKRLSFDSSQIIKLSGLQKEVLLLRDEISNYKSTLLLLEKRISDFHLQNRLAEEKLEILYTNRETLLSTLKSHLTDTAERDWLKNEWHEALKQKAIAIKERDALKNNLFWRLSHPIRLMSIGFYFFGSMLHKYLKQMSFNVISKKRNKKKILSKKENMETQALEKTLVHNLDESTHEQTADIYQILKKK